MGSQPRLILLGSPPPLSDGWRDRALTVSAGDTSLVAEMLQTGSFAGLMTDTETALSAFAESARNRAVLRHVDQSLALLDLSGTVLWANPGFRRLCTADPVGRPVIAAIGSPTIACDVSDPLTVAAGGLAVSARACWIGSSSQPLDLTIRPVLDSSSRVHQLIVIARDVGEVLEQQRKLDTLHQAGRDLSGLDPVTLAQMNYPTRVELLKQNLRRYIRDLLQYDIIELRLLDRRTGELKPLLHDGMTAGAATRVLYARATDNGVTGHVAATGKSYLCPDTAADPLYIEGASDARSSMTVPIVFNDEVVGTLNVESPRTAGFGADELQFTELFSKEVAAALHTLELLSAQQTCTAAQSMQAVHREIALPLDEVFSAAALIAERLGDSDPEVSAQIRRIAAAAHGLKANVRRVEQDLGAEPPAGGDGPPPLAGKRVLVVEDDERTRRLAHILLNRLGAEVETVATAVEGLALAAWCEYDAVFLDYKPSDMGGYEAYCRFRAARPAAVVAMTTGFVYDSSHSIIKARADGLDHVLFKPFRQDQVVRAVLGETAPTSSPAPVGLNGQS